MKGLCRNLLKEVSMVAFADESCMGVGMIEIESFALMVSGDEVESTCT